MSIKQKSENKNYGVNRLFVLVFSDQDANPQKFKSRRYYLPKGIIKNYNIIVNGKNFYDQAIASHIKRYKEIRKLTTREGEDYTTGCLLDYDYIKSYYRLITVDLNRQKELDADPKAVHWTIKKQDVEDNASDEGNN